MFKNTLEKDILKEIFNISLSKAADSLSFFVGSKILIKDLQLSVVDNISADDLKHHFAQAEAILETRLKGEYSGLTYLLFSEEDVKNFFKVAHPINPDSTLEDELSKELLLEADNILTASVVSALADILKNFIYGDVPKFYSPGDKELVDQISEELAGLTTLKIVANYESEGLTVKPVFIWMIDIGFINRLHEFASNEEEVLKLKELV